MPNRVIKDAIWSSPTLAKLPLDVQLHWPRLLLMADDWGCFNADPDVIKGLVYPKIATMTVRKICDLLKTYTEAGLIFLWKTGERLWGFFTSWHGHQFCNATHLNDDGKQARHQRKTPEPPENELSAYLAQHNQISQEVSGKLEQVRAVQNKYRNPNPNPNPNPRKIYGEFQNVTLTDHEIEKLDTKFGTDDARRRIENLSQYIASKGDKYKDHYATLLQWAAREKEHPNGHQSHSPLSKTGQETKANMQRLIARLDATEHEATHD